MDYADRAVCDLVKSTAKCVCRHRVQEPIMDMSRGKYTTFETNANHGKSIQQNIHVTLLPLNASQHVGQSAWLRATKFINIHPRLCRVRKQKKRFATAIRSLARTHYRLNWNWLDFSSACYSLAFRLLCDIVRIGTGKHSIRRIEWAAKTDGSTFYRKIAFTLHRTAVRILPSLHYVTAFPVCLSISFTWTYRRSAPYRWRTAHSRWRKSSTGTSTIIWCKCTTPVVDRTQTQCNLHIVCSSPKRTCSATTWERRNRIRVEGTCTGCRRLRRASARCLSGHSVWPARASSQRSASPAPTHRPAWLPTGTTIGKRSRRCRRLWRSRRDESTLQSPRWWSRQRRYPANITTQYLRRVDLHWPSSNALDQKCRRAPFIACRSSSMRIGRSSPSSAYRITHCCGSAPHWSLFRRWKVFRSWFPAAIMLKFGCFYHLVWGKTKSRDTRWCCMCKSPLPLSTLATRWIFGHNYSVFGCHEYRYSGPGTQLVTQKWRVDWNTYLSGSKDYIVAQIDGRGSSGQGYRLLYEVYRRLGTVEVSDQLEVTEYLRDNLHFVDKRRVGIWGWSYGGYTAGLALANPMSLFQCGASVAPVVNWKLYGMFNRCISAMCGTDMV